MKQDDIVEKVEKDLNFIDEELTNAQARIFLNIMIFNKIYTAPATISNLSQFMKISYYHLQKIMKLLIAKNFIVRYREGRRTFIHKTNSSKIGYCIYILGHNDIVVKKFFDAFPTIRKEDYKDKIQEEVDEYAEKYGIPVKDIKKDEQLI